MNGIPAAARICRLRAEVDARISTLTLYRRTGAQAKALPPANQFFSCRLPVAHALLRAAFTLV